jgi:hypothetical protein
MITWLFMLNLDLGFKLTLTQNQMITWLFVILVEINKQLLTNLVQMKP